MPDEDDDEGQDELPEPARRHLRKTEKELREARAELEEARGAKRELVAIKAGLDTSNPLSQFFLKHYDGPLEPDAMKAAMAENGITSATTSGQQGDDPGDKELREQRDAERQAAMQGQQHLGEQKFGDYRPEGANAQSRLVADIREAQAKLTKSDFAGAIEEGREALREVLHRHNMIMADEID